MRFVSLGLVLLLAGCNSSDDDAKGAAPTPPANADAGANGGLTTDGEGFGAQTIGAAAEHRTFTVRNTTAADVTLGAPTISGDGAADYKAGTLADPVVRAGASVTVDVEFQPSAKGVRSATLGVGPATIALGGSGDCPKAPTDLTSRGVTEACTTPIYVAVGERSGRIVSTDGMTWSHDQRDRTNCLTNMDGTLNCGDKCTTIAASTCSEKADQSLDCARPDPADAAKNICTGFDDSAFRVAFGLGLIVTAGDFGIFTSADAGVTWAKAGMPAAQQWNQGVHVAGVAFGNGRFVVASGGTNYTSTDGTTWTKTADTVGGGYYGFGDLVFGGGHFVATGNDHGTEITKVSEDGVAWHDPHPVAYSKIAFGNGVFIAVKNGMKGVSKDNGVTWQDTTDTCADWKTWEGNPGDCVGGLATITFDGKTFHACGGDHCLTTPDGETWAYDAKAKTFDWATIYAGDHFVLLQGNSFYSTPDLTSWGDKHTLEASFRPDSVGYGRVLSP